MSPVIETLADLVRINSVNPEWGGPGEAAVADYVKSFLRRADIEFEVQDVLPGRPNVIARLRGEDSSRALVLEAHMDTVSVADMTIAPFEPRIENGRMWGRGSCDTKAGLAAMLQSMATLKAGGVKPAVDIILAAVVDEEHTYKGVTAFVESLTGKPLPEAAVVAEPTELRVVRANKGAVRWRIITHGRAAHSSKPHLGANAISAMATVIQAIENDAPNLNIKPHPLVGPPTCSIGVIEGGRQVNFVPEHCAITLDRRLIPGETASVVLSYYDELLNPARKRHPDIKIETEAPYLTDEAMETPADSMVVQAVSGVLTRMKLAAEPLGVPFGCDATKLSRAGIPSVIFGPGSIDQAHTADEFVDLNQVELAFDFYLKFLLEFGKP